MQEKDIENVEYTKEEKPICICGTKRPFIWKFKIIKTDQIYYSCAECGHRWKIEDNDLSLIPKFWRKY